VRRRAVLGGLTLIVAAAATSVVAPPVNAGVARSGGQIQLLDPGANPRAPIRLKADPAPETETLTFSTEITQSGVASAHVGPLAIQTRISITGIGAGPNGTIRVPYTYGSFKLLDISVGPAQQLNAVRASLAGFQGFGGQFTLSSTGAVLANRFVIPRTVSSSVQSLLQQVSDQSDQLSVPLPTQAIGVGARWRGTTQLVAGGIKFKQTYEYTLLSRDGNRLSLDVRYTQTAPRQRVAAAGLPSGATLTVTGYHIAGAGTSVLDLSQVIPASSHLTAQGLQIFHLQRGGQSGTLNQQVHVGVDLTLTQ
jgi:hypothetical protein